MGSDDPEKDQAPMLRWEPHLWWPALLFGLTPAPGELWASHPWEARGTVVRTDPVCPAVSPDGRVHSPTPGGTASAPTFRRVLRGRCHVWSAGRGHLERGAGPGLAGGQRAADAGPARSWWLVRGAGGGRRRVRGKGRSTDVRGSREQG